MQPFDPRSLPFLNRTQLDFQIGSSIGLQIGVMTNKSYYFFVHGATKAGVFTFRIDTVAGAGMTFYNLGIADLPIWLTISDDDDQFISGECFARADLVVNSNVVAHLVSGYVSSNRAISFPPVFDIASEYTKNILTEFQSADPAAGAEISMTIPSGLQYKVNSMSLQLVTDGTAATRTVQLQITLGGSTMPISFISTTTQTASLTRNYCFFPLSGGAGTTIGTTIQVPTMQDLILTSATTIKTVTNNLQAGDNYGKLSIYAEQYQNEF